MQLITFAFGVATRWATTLAPCFLAACCVHSFEFAIEEAAASEPTAAIPIDAWRLLEPFWDCEASHRESVLFVQEEGESHATARLFFPASEVLAIHSADGTTRYELGADVELSADGRQLTLTNDSRIPRLCAAELYPAAGSERSISHKSGDPSRFVLFDNGHWFHDQQVEVTYRHPPETWPGPTPRFAGNQLPGTLEKLRAGKPLAIGVSGDSISAGGNASGATHAAPGMPAFPELVASQLEETYGSKIALDNRAVGGWTSHNGLADLDALLVANPDLVIIAYGMNDVGARNPDAFRETIKTMLDQIHRANPAIEVILVSTMLGHSGWVYTPPEMFGPYRDALASLTGPGVALADVTSVWSALLSRKRDVDLTGNGVNHPNDFGHRLYAEAILALLVEAPASEAGSPESANGSEGNAQPK